MKGKLYDIDSHIRSFDAEVVACEFNEKKKLYEIQLTESAFFPEGGGQHSDKGTLNGKKVMGVSEDPVRVVHLMEEPMEIGSKVHGEIDWEYRFSNMQQHSGEHIFSGIVYNRKGYHNVGFHLGDDVTTLDFDGPMTEEEILSVEEKVNEYIRMDVPIRITYPDPEALKAMDYRSKKELEGDIRIVEFGLTDEIIDRCACCAPHVRTTGEIGLLKVVKFENYKGGVRLTILCGSRAVKDYGEKHRILMTMAEGLSTSCEKVAASVDKLKKERQELGEKVSKLSAALVEFKAEKILKENAGKEGAILVKEDLLDNNGARELVNLLIRRTQSVCVVMLSEGERTFLIAGCSEGDLQGPLMKLRKEKQFKGGGSQNMFQGTLPKDMDISDCF